MDEMRTKSGTRLSEALIDQLANEAEAGYDLSKAEIRSPGRPSLGVGPSKPLQVRIEADLDASLRSRAAAEGRSISEIARDALRAYVSGQ